MTKRETIRKLTLAGEDKADIADALGVSLRTVDSHVYRLRRDGLLPQKRRYIASALTGPTYDFMVREAAKRKVKPAELQAMVAEAIATDPANSSFLQNILSEV